MLPAMYSVYKQPGEVPVAVHKNRLQCASAMRVTVQSFDSYASWTWHGKRKLKKWEIVRHEEEEQDDE